MNCCNANGQCTQGHECPIRSTSYKCNFDHLGNMTKGDYHPWRRVDIALVIALFITIILIGFSGRAESAELELSIGQTRYLKSNDTDYWQTGPEHEGFRDSWTVKAPSFTLGLTGKSGNYRWHTYYWNGGNTHLDSMAVVPDSAYDIVNQRAATKDAKFYRFVGDQRTDGVYATLGYEFNIKGVVVEPYAGIGLYRNQFAMDVLDENEQIYKLPVDKTQLNLGPVIGVAVGNGKTSLFVDAKYIGRTGDYPGIVQGYCVTTGLRFSF